MALLDIGLRSMSGLDVLREMRSFDSKARDCGERIWCLAIGVIGCQVRRMGLR
jgi:hypothetical protein